MLRFPAIAADCVQRIEDRLSCRVELHPLKPLQARLRRAYSAWRHSGQSNPFPWRVDTADGRSFKLLVAGPTGGRRLQQYKDLLGLLAARRLVPSVIIEASDYLLVEFRRGQVPDFAHPRFGSAFARALGEIHAVEPGAIPKADVLASLTDDLEQIARRRVIRGQLAEKLLKIMEGALPERIATGLVYGDLKPANFLIDESGELFFPDVGGFQRKQVVDIFLFGSELLAKLDLPLFRQAYRSTGGPLDFSLQQPLEIMNAAKLTAYRLRTRGRIASWDIARQFAYWRWIRTGAGRLQSHAG